MTKIEMINMAIDLSYVQGRLEGNPGLTECVDMLRNAIDTLVEEIEPMEKHDGADYQQEEEE